MDDQDIAGPYNASESWRRRRRWSGNQAMEQDWVGICCGWALALSLVGIFVRKMIKDDQERARRQQESRPIPDRIAAIRKDAAFMCEQLERALNRSADESPERFPWVRPTLEFYHRLEALAAAPRPCAEDADRLADEAERYIQANRLKGICVAMLARRLAELSRRLD